jgi:hypothetical protein
MPSDRSGIISASFAAESPPHSRAIGRRQTKLNRDDHDAADERRLGEVDPAALGAGQYRPAPKQAAQVF